MSIIFYIFAFYTTLLLLLSLYIVNQKNIVSVRSTVLVIVAGIWTVLLTLLVTDITIIAASISILIIISIYLSQNTYLIFHFDHKEVAHIIENSFNMLLTDFKNKKGAYRYGEMEAYIKHESIFDTLKIGTIYFGGRRADEKDRLIKNLIIKKFDTIYPTIHINLTN